MTLTEPKIVEKAAQPYAAIELRVKQPEIAQKAPPLIADVIAWLKAHGMRHSGPPFFNYRDFHPDGSMTMQVGMPTAQQPVGESGIVGGTLPGGRFASVTHTGPYNELGGANMALDAWTKKQGIALDGAVGLEGFAGATRLEIYHSDPEESPGADPVTEVAFRLAE